MITRVYSPPTDGTLACPICLLDECLVIPAENVLYVLNRRGSFELRARKIHVLHERIQPYLNGAHTERELLAAVPSSQTAALRIYFAKLREVGALTAAPDSIQADDRHRREQGALYPASDPSLAAEQVAITLDARRPDAADHPHRLYFVTPEEAGRLLLRFPDRVAGSLTCVVAEPVEDGLPLPEELQQRAVYAHWLLRNYRDVAAAERRVRVFRLDRGSGTLTRMLEVSESEATDPSTILDRLDVIRRADVDQIPLTVLTASHRCFRATVSYCGVSYSRAHSYTICAFIARALLWPTESKPFCTFRSGMLGAPTRTYAPVLVARAQTSSMSTAPSWPQLRLQLLEEFARQNLPAEAVEVWTEIDLLHEPCSTPAVAVLQDMLHLRLPCLSVRVGTTSDGLWVFRYGEGELAGSSFIREKAILELLLAAAWAKFYARFPVSNESLPPVPACDALDFVSAQELNQLVNTRIGLLRRRSERVRVVVRRLRCWGTAVWVGALASRPV